MYCVTRGNILWKQVSFTINFKIACVLILKNVCVCSYDEEEEKFFFVCLNYLVANYSCS